MKIRFSDDFYCVCRFSAILHIIVSVWTPNGQLSIYVLWLVLDCSGHHIQKIVAENYCHRLYDHHATCFGEKQNLDRVENFIYFFLTGKLINLV